MRTFWSLLLSAVLLSFVAAPTSDAWAAPTRYQRQAARRHADTGRGLGVCVCAARSVGFIGLKQGMFTGEARNYCGRVLFDDLGVPPALYERIPVTVRRAEMAMLGGILGKRRRSDHKGSYGHVLIIGGESGFAGAARMAG